MLAAAPLTGCLWNLCYIVPSPNLSNEIYRVNMQKTQSSECFALGIKLTNLVNSTAQGCTYDLFQYLCRVCTIHISGVIFAFIFSVFSYEFFNYSGLFSLLETFCYSTMSPFPNGIIFYVMTPIVMLSFYSRCFADEIPSHNVGIIIKYLPCGSESNECSSLFFFGFWFLVFLLRMLL